jgi:hypothetical protein
MIFENWISRYSEVCNAARADDCVSEFKPAIRGKRLVLYVDGAFGAMAYEPLRKFDAEAEFIADKQ